MQRWLKRTLGILLLILGIIGLFLPFLQGILLILAGAYLLEIDWIKERVEKYKRHKSKRHGK